MVPTFGILDIQCVPGAPHMGVCLCVHMCVHLCACVYVYKPVYVMSVCLSVSIHFIYVIVHEYTPMLTLELKCVYVCTLV